MYPVSSDWRKGGRVGRWKEREACEQQDLSISPLEEVLDALVYGWNRKVESFSECGLLSLLVESLKD